jgi:hypothetical protein
VGDHRHQRAVDSDQPELNSHDTEVEGASMTDNLRGRIAAAIRDHPQGQEWGIPEEECVNCPRFFDGDWAAHVADAVIAALPELTQPVSVEPIGDYQYVCHPCGSSFSFYSSSTMQQFALMHSGSHNTKEGGTVPDTLRERIAPDDLCKCGHRAHRHDNFGLSRCCHYRECGCHHFDLAVRWRGDE